ncbi:MAG TPA: ABC transporter permease [Anaerolineales bacterium]|nr:ABC transporter permease [Anaerolineales bacterium]
MMRVISRYIRLYLIQAWVAYRALFAWSTPFSYFVSKFGFTFFAMVFFVFMGRFVGLADPVYIVIGNILLIPATNGLGGVSMTVANEKAFGALSYLLGSPAPRAPLFLGRAFYHTLDSFLTVAIALPVAIWIFKLDVSDTNFSLVLLCILITTFAASGMGFIMGSLSLVNRDGWMITSTLSLALYILVGANFPVQALPVGLQAVSYSLPMTRGIAAARAALGGGDWAAVSSLLGVELLLGVLYITIGYVMFRVLERRSMVSGTLDNI